MFGYVTAYKPEMKMKDFYKYKAYGKIPELV